MPDPRTVFCTLAAGLALAVPAPAARADMISVPASRFGNYAADGIGNINSPGFQNYFAGYSTPSATAERRNFFIFPTASFTSLSLVSATLVLYVPLFAPGVTTDGGPGYISPDPSETFRLSPSFVPASEVGDPTNDPTESMFIWGTLGTGPLAGSIEIFPSAMGTYVHIPLTAMAVAALDTIGPGDIVFGGMITSLDHTRPMVLDELLFSFTDVPGSGSFTVPTLVLEYVPAPSSAAAVLGAAGLLARRRRTGS